ncbi:hypothetical protein [Bifidobacterium hapali]|uniref:hypothetical protein n=1 Tax=Bifidobacterium hapali TaxID=1630172 RepID=UPI001303AB65|nr:hypothetical protein [Bifidobacterium hapali]
MVAPLVRGAAISQIRHLGAQEKYAERDWLTAYSRRDTTMPNGTVAAKHVPARDPA